MELINIIKNRRSTRKYKGREISKDILKHIKDALIWAPSAGNLQARMFYFVFNNNIKDQLAQAAFGQAFIAEAPLVIVCCADLEKISSRYEKRGEELYCICDVSASIQNLMLIATENKLGTCWVGAFDEKAVSTILDLSKVTRPIAIVPIGYPDELPQIPRRANVKEVVEEIV